MRKKAMLIGATVGAVVLVSGAGVAVARDATDDGPDTPITGEELRRASDAALAHTEGGRVTDTEVGDEESTYEVEVTLDDGSQVDVQLDDSFVVVSTSADEESPGDED
jgi:hypothetical protein